MLKQDIVVGKSYVNEEAGLIREVVEEVDRRHVRLNTFELATGRLVPTRHNIWSRLQLAHWAEREATQPESTLVHPFAATAWFDALFPSDRAGTPIESLKTSLEGTPGYHPAQPAK